MIKTTENEKALLVAIRDSEYNDEHEAYHQVWVACLMGFVGTPGFAGTMSSLVQKGLAVSSLVKNSKRRLTDDSKFNDATCYLTDKGLKAISNISFKN